LHVLRIVLTLPVTAGSGERSFSKLKLIKTYLRSTTQQERLTNLAILKGSDNELSREIDTKEIVNNFAAWKARELIM